MSHRFIIVGAGYAGLTAAIELTRKGFEVEVFEAAEKLTRKGDIINTNPSLTRIVSKWGDSLTKLVAVSAANDHQLVYDHHGNVLHRRPSDFVRDGCPTLIAPRGYLHMLMYEFALSIGVKIHLGTRITKAFEEDDCAGVYIDAEGKRVVADAIIAADGVHSVLRTEILKAEGHVQSSGLAMYRSFFDLKHLDGKKEARQYFEGPKDQIAAWIGPGVNAAIFTDKKIGKIGVFLTHPDEYTVEESWASRGGKAEMLKYVEGWDERLQQIFSCVPEDELYDWRLVCRDPVKNWVSPKGRVVFVGDTVHPHLPNSGSGAMQAFEDGATIGALVDKLRPESLPIIFKAFQTLRYERVGVTQLLGWDIRYRTHQTDLAAAKKNPKLLDIFIEGEWLLAHDAEKYAEENAEAVLQSLKSGTEFKNTNLPENYTHQEWDVKSLMSSHARPINI